METLDWIIVAIYGLAVTAVGLAFAKKAKGGMEDYFLSGRQLTWWLAGTSLVATSFASDTPLFVSGLVRRYGVSGNWQWWFMALASVASLFFFARLWRRAHVVTDNEFIELRYGPGAGAILRGVKAGFMGIGYNVYAMGALPVLGLSKILETTTNLSKTSAVICCAFVAIIYSVFAGLWGVVAADFIQFICAVSGAVILAVYAVSAVGGFHALWAGLSDMHQTAFLASHTPESFWDSPFVFFLSLILLQWWARGFEGDGMAVQKLSACKNEKHSFYAMLWYNIGHYAIRSWPWIIVGLASLVLLPSVTNSMGVEDPEMAYPKMIVELLPTGLRGFMVAGFFAAFTLTADSHLNWGSSYLVNDIYKRFWMKNASQKHYVWVGRLCATMIMIGGALVALYTSSIIDAFYNILLLFSGAGLVGVGRWFWWRINAWSEISAILASGFLTLMSSPLAIALGWPDARAIHLLIVVFGSLVVWLPVTLLTRPCNQEVLIAFYRRIKPFALGWGPIARECPDVKSPDSFGMSLLGWATGVVFILGSTVSIGKWLLGVWPDAIMFSVIAFVGLLGVRYVIQQMTWET